MSRNKPSRRNPPKPRPGQSPSATLDGSFTRAFDLAQDLHQRGLLVEAEHAYRQILQRRPDHGGALHYLGAIAMQLGQVQAALPLMERALSVDPENPRLLCNLGRAQALAGNLALAEQYLRRARALDDSLLSTDGYLAQVLAMTKDYAEAITYYDSVLARDIPTDVRCTSLFERAQCLVNSGQKPAALASLEEAVALQSGHLAAHRLLGHLYREQSRFPEALDTLLKALEVQPDDLDSLIFLGRTFYDIKSYDSAEQTFQMAQQAHPSSWEAQNWLSSVCRITGRLDEALVHAKQAVTLCPTGEQALLTLGNVHLTAERLDEAEAIFLELIQLHPDSATGLANLGTLYWVRGDTERGRDFNTRALAVDPHCPIALFNTCISEMARGNLAKAWPLYDYGIQTGQRRPPFYVNIPLWPLDQSLAGRTLLIRREQGVGDELFHASLFPELIAQAGHCIIECSPKLESLMARSFPQATVLCPSALSQRADLFRASDYQILSGSAAPRLRPDLAAFPSPHVFLRADAARVQGFRDRLDALPGRVKIAVAWRSRNMNVARIKFYMTLAEMAPILTLPDTCFVSVQYDDDPASIRAEIDAARELGITLHMFDDLDTLDDLDGVAALIDACDLVLCAPTTVARIAGGLGKPTLEATPGLVEQHFGQLYSPFTPSVKVVKPPVPFDKPTMLTMLEDDVRAFTAGTTWPN